ncbi:hypothetical protein BBJ28_00026879, partial [Nothophytophthora sp. Chile5]
MTPTAIAAIGVRQRVVAFEAPLRERRTLRAMRRAVSTRLDLHWGLNEGRASCGSVAIADAQIFRLVSFLLSSEGTTAYPFEAQQLVAQLVRLCAAPQDTGIPSALKAVSDCAKWTQWADATCLYAVMPVSRGPLGASLSRRMSILVTHRPRDLLPLCMSSARRAVRLVHAVVALVTANAYISTLGGGHFLCRQLSQSTLMAKLQIGISLGLKDPILESKCRVNLAYNALQLGRFGRASRILRHEKRVAERLDSAELRKVCHAADVYLSKMYRLHQEQVLFHRNSAAAATPEGCGGDG